MCVREFVTLVTVLIGISCGHVSASHWGGLPFAERRRKGLSKHILYARRSALHFLHSLCLVRKVKVPITTECFEFALFFFFFHVYGILCESLRFTCTE